MTALLGTLVGYNAWANKDLLDTLATVDPVAHDAELNTAIRLVNHYHVVARIFAGHLSGRPHGLAGTNTAGTPALDDLRASTLVCDDWYLDYVRLLSPAAAAEQVAFTFTDGDKGFMSREEMVTHVTLHGGYHRGEVGQILKKLKVPPALGHFRCLLAPVPADQAAAGGGLISSIVMPGFDQGIS